MAETFIDFAVEDSGNLLLVFSELVQRFGYVLPEFVLSCAVTLIDSGDVPVEKENM
jgi:hypothetical protein